MYRREFITDLLALSPAVLLLGAKPAILLASSPRSAGEVPYVIFEDDFDSDSDGPMALCMLLELEAAGECKIIACGTCELHEDSTAAMAATLHYFGRGDIPLGSYRDDLRPYDSEITQLYDESYFAGNMAADTFGYGHSRRQGREYPDAVEVYVNALNALPVGAKAKLILGGGHNNLRALLEIHTDVVRNRVSELHFMGGWVYPENGKTSQTEWNRDSNLYSTRFDTKYIAENWPREIPVFIADTSVGLGVMGCQQQTRKQLSDLHPAKRIHILYRIDWESGHNALDGISVISAVRGFTNLNGVDLKLQRGTLEIHPTTGLHRFIYSTDGPHTRLVRSQDSVTAKKLADYADSILLLRGGDANDGIFRDEFVAGRGKNKSETLQTRRGWIKAGDPDSDTLIDASDAERAQYYSERVQYVQFNGNSSAAPFNVQVKDFGSKDIRARARMMVKQSDGYVGLCVRSDASANACGLNLRLQPGSPGLHLYSNGLPLVQTRTHGAATDFAINTWYILDLQVEGDQLIGRLFDDYDNRKLLEQVEVALSGIDDRHYAGMLARDKGEWVDWFQSKIQ